MCVACGCGSGAHLPHGAPQLWTHEQHSLTAEFRHGPRPPRLDRPDIAHELHAREPMTHVPCDVPCDVLLTPLQAPVLSPSSLVHSGDTRSVTQVPCVDVLLTPLQALLSTSSLVHSGETRSVTQVPRLRELAAVSLHTTPAVE